MFTMDAKDLELLTNLTAHGRWDAEALSAQLGISVGNVERRIKLLVREGVVLGFSAFFDRRMFGYDTTFLKLHFDPGHFDRVLQGVSRMPQVASVYPNIDDFMIVEVVHWDAVSLKAAIGSMERIASPYTVTDHYEPLLPEAIPERPEGDALEILWHLVRDGRTDIEALSEVVGISMEKVSIEVAYLFDRCGVKIKPMVQEDLINPFPTFSIILSMAMGCSFESCYSEVLRISRESWDSFPMLRPKGVWLKCFGRDLHAMDLMLERFRRMKEVDDVMVILPDSITLKRSVDLGLLKGSSIRDRS
ncbi:MAG: winged helix-turn-helix transcriptional regulator [Candidatus Thermoplasmatota archaeon]|nr:winged helix-turn-helix transcriptional regulator [Candidatus Thermoplasmatota archaeon]